MIEQAEEHIRGQRVFVTGATGFIGGALTRRLHALGAEAIALERTPGKGDALRAAGVTVVRGDITDHARMGAILAEHHPQIVMHIAAWLSGKPLSNYQRVNVEATANLAEAANAHGVERFVYTSSIMVYDGHGDKDVTEATPIHEYGDPYGDSKIRSERELHAIRPEAVILRPGMVYGPESRGWTVRIIKWAKAGRVPLVDGGRGSAYPVYVGNLVDMLLLAATHEAAPGEVFNAVDDGPVSLGEYLGAYMAMVPTERALRLPGWLVSAGAAVLDPFLPAYNYRSLVNQMRGRGLVLNNKIARKLGWLQRVSLTEGLKRSEAWLREQGYLGEKHEDLPLSGS
jgi:nucleoside-diphosphate-sugar epimerase